jgi:hypothetical protein
MTVQQLHAHNWSSMAFLTNFLSVSFQKSDYDRFFNKADFQAIDATTI